MFQTNTEITYTYIYCKYILGIYKTAGGMVDRSGKTPRLAAVAAEINLDEGLLGLLRGAFDSEGELSAQ